MKCPVCNENMINGKCPSCGMRISNNKKTQVEYDTTLKRTGSYKHLDTYTTPPTAQKNYSGQQSSGNYKSSENKSKEKKRLKPIVIISIIITVATILSPAGFFSGIIDKYISDSDMPYIESQELSDYYEKIGDSYDSDEGEFVWNNDIGVYVCESSELFDYLGNIYDTNSYVDTDCFYNPSNKVFFDSEYNMIDENDGHLMNYITLSQD